MNRQQIDALVKTMNVDTATGSVDARTQQIVVRLLGDLFQAIEDLRFELKLKFGKVLNTLRMQAKPTNSVYLRQVLVLSTTSTYVQMKPMPKQALQAEHHVPSKVLYM